MESFGEAEDQMICRYNLVVCSLAFLLFYGMVPRPQGSES